MKHSFNNLLILQHVEYGLSSGFMKFRDVQIAETQLLSSNAHELSEGREERGSDVSIFHLINRRRLARADTPLISQRIYK